MDLLCSDAIRHNARVYGKDVAVVCEGQSLSWHELDVQTNRVANALHALGCVKGDKVALFLPNSLPAFVAFWGIAKSGCVIVALNTLLEGSALARLTNASDAKVIFVDSGTAALVDSIRPSLENIRPEGYFTFGAAAAGWQSAADLIGSGAASPPAVKVQGDDSMTVIFTSGTTGVPKGIEHTHFGRLNYPHGFGMGLRINRYSVAICATPIYATGTWITMFPTMYRGGRVVLLSKFTAEGFFAAVHAERGTHAFLVPTQYIALLQHQPSINVTGSLQVLVTAGQSLAPATYEALCAQFPSAQLYEIYGMSEGFSTLAIPEDRQRGKQGSVGKPAFLEDIRIIGPDGEELAAGEAGEIVGYGPGMMKGYYARPDMTRDATWVSPAGRTYMRSGDIGHLDADGFLYISGRLKDMIKSGGMNIYAVDIEQIIMQHAAVRETAVIGVPHEKWGETPIAVVILKAGASITANELLAWVNERVSKYQRLLKIVLQADMPRATYGKIQKQTLRDQYRAKQRGEGQ
jgi:acyl-CoA synthetase (AMP-forming)/AMP-acid ligase II